VREAEAVLDKASQIGGDSIAVVERLAYHYHVYNYSPGLAEDFYRQLLKLRGSRPDINALGNLAQIVLASGRQDEGATLVSQVLESEAVPGPLELEVRFYALTHGLDVYEDSLNRIRELLEQGFRSPDWSFEPNLEWARAHHVPNLSVLIELASQISAPEPHTKGSAGGGDG
jgi:hypothetical protein